MKVYRIITHLDDEPKEIFKTKEELEDFCNEYNIKKYEIEECPVYYHYVVKYKRIDNYTFELDRVFDIKTLALSSNKVYTFYDTFNISFNSDKELSDDEIDNKVINIIKDTDYYIIDNNIDTIYLKYKN